MKLWITRDNGHEKYRDNKHVHLWEYEPIHNAESGWRGDDGAFIALELAEFKSLTGLPLPRRGSKKLVEIEMTITPTKGKS